MGLFRKEEKKPQLPELPELPPLPDMPEPISLQKIPVFEPKKQEKFPKIQDIPEILAAKKQYDHLPTFATSSAGERFSREAIKTAISSQPPKTLNPDNFEENESFDELKPFAPPRVKTIEIGQEFQPSKFEHVPEPSHAFTKEEPEIRHIEASPNEIKKPFIKPLLKETSFQTMKIPSSVKEKKPIYIRIDKFENALKNFSEIRREVKEITNLLKEIREKRAKEEADLSEWEHQLEQIKTKIASIDSEFFEKIE